MAKPVLVISYAGDDDQIRELMRAWAETFAVYGVSCTVQPAPGVPERGE